IDGGNGNDTINGGDGDDNIFGGNSDDTLTGGRGNDIIDGGNGDDKLDGGSGNNQLLGGNGDDVVTVGDGGKTLTGGNGDDRFVFGPVFGNDVITDFSHGDKIDFSTIAFPDFAAVQGAMHQVGGDTVISLGAGHAITLQHVAINSLDSGAFSFH